METEYFWQNKIHNKEVTCIIPVNGGKMASLNEKNSIPEESKHIAFKISSIAGIMAKGDSRE